MFLFAFIMFLLFSLSAAATTPIAKRSTHSASSHRAIVFVLIFVATLVILALLAFVVYRVFIKGRQCEDPTPRFIPWRLLLRIDTSSNQSSDLEKGAKGLKVPIGPISSPVLLFGTGSMVLDPGAIREANYMEGVGVTDARPVSKKHGAIVTQGSQNSEYADQPINHPLGPVKHDIFVINNEKGLNGEGLTEKDIEALGNVAEPCDDDITICAEERATFVERFNTYYCREEDECFARPATTRVAKTGLFDYSSSSLDSLNIRDLVNSTKSNDSEEAFSRSRAGDERNVTTSPSSAFSMSDIADDDTLPALAPNSQLEAIDSPTDLHERHLQPSRSMFVSKEDAQAFLRSCRVDMQRDPDVHVLILNPASRASGPNDRASMPTSQASSFSMEPESTQNEPPCSSKRSSAMAYRPVLSSPLASDSEGCRSPRSKSFSRPECSKSPSIVCDNNSASELLVDVLRRSYINRIFTKTYSDLQRLIDDDDLFHHDEVPRPESPLFFEFEVNPSFFGPEVIDALSNNIEAKSFYVDDDSVEPMEIASTSWLAETTMVDATLDSTTPAFAQSNSVLCKDTHAFSYDSDISRPAATLSERVMRSSSTVCTRLPALAEESEEDTDPSASPTLAMPSKVRDEGLSSEELPAKCHTLSPRHSVKSSSSSGKTLGKAMGSPARGHSVSTEVTLPNPIDNLPRSRQAQSTTPITKICRGPPAAGPTRQKSATTGKREHSVSNSLSTKSTVGPTKPLETSRAKRRSLSDISNLANKSSSSSTATRQSCFPVSPSRTPSNPRARKSSSATNPIKSSPPPSPPPRISPPPIPPRRRRSSTLFSPSPAVRDAALAIKKS
ncbi:uncharacterized protein FOMMEDRAFT_144895 [Fomitiporia mediterranea MF3/22]|uniref:uncharacterized protein n=1 Tax=Fomitiporia mediterranea (strain MF3/22) TaxID=694068 RepID=UPI0004409864|nr:uncharacterized protein FOMMEDRAFT_144895 [Fomitiporia mediterranea MF3/22]EJD07160.1 hypothetical protein FOMMEDRAFT_144895 [Fomitiporia mediterranea MF3/22]